jgi:hypothetical protein
MSGLLKLRKEAEIACKFRGHKLGKWATYHRESRSLANNACKVCEDWVQCNSNPAPNDIDIGGPAVALNCRKGAKDEQ